MEDVLDFDDDERDFLNAVTDAQDRLDTQSGSPAGTVVMYIRLSNALHHLGMEEKAVQMIDRALLINPRERDALFAKSMLLFFGKKYAEARRCLDKLIADRDDENARYLAELIEQISGG